MFNQAIVRRPGESLVNGITTAGLGQPDYQLALKQHDAYIQALEACGLSVTAMEAEEDYPDGMFVEDVALVMPGLAVVTRPGADSRRGEIVSMETQLKQFFDQIESIEAPGTVDAGDIMMVGKHFYIGLSERTNAAGAEQMIGHLRKHGFDGSTVTISEGLHFKSSVSYLENNNIVVTGELVEKSELSNFNPITIRTDDAYSANSVWINGHVLVPSGFPETSQSVTAQGYDVIELDVSEFQKLDGGLSCLSLRFLILLVEEITELSNDVAALIQQSRDYQASLYPSESINQDDPEYLVSGDMYFVGAYDGERLCGLGGVKIMRDTPDYGEIKNLFVDPACRGLGISRMVMQALESHLIKNKISLCRLETGVSQPESLGLYHSLGYRNCDAYGDYEPDPLSVFMEKTLDD